MTAKKRADSPGPHKILTLDGGGIRGAMTVEVLSKIEEIVKEKGANTLAEYFDYIAGTSTGAILAAGLALGWSVSDLRTFYESRGEEMFGRASWLKRTRYKYDAEPLGRLLQSEIGADINLGDDKIQTLLMMVMRNATTDSPWPLSNNPYAKYNHPDRKDCNLNIPLWQLVRASTAAPVYFPPERVVVGAHEFLFVDGAITCYNNPSFQTFLMATSEPYRLNWETGEANLLVVSVGTGTNANANEGLAPGDMNILYNASTVPSALMYAALNEQDFLCRTFGNCIWGESFDREIGEMCSSVKDSLCRGPVKEKLFTYVRYNAELTHEGLERIGITNVDPIEVQQLDAVSSIANLQKIGNAVASNHVKEEHFYAF